MFTTEEVFNLSPVTYCHIEDHLPNYIFYTDKESVNYGRDRIIRIVAKYYSIHFSELYLSWGRREVSLARQVSMFLIRTNTNLSLASIGKHFHYKKNHSNVIKAIKVLRDLMANDSIIKNDVEYLQSKI